MLWERFCSPYDHHQWSHVAKPSGLCSQLLRSTKHCCPFPPFGNMLLPRLLGHCALPGSPPSIPALSSHSPLLAVCPAPHCGPSPGPPPHCHSVPEAAQLLLHFTHPPRAHSAKIDVSKQELPLQLLTRPCCLGVTLLQRPVFEKSGSTLRELENSGLLCQRAQKS